MAFESPKYNEKLSLKRNRILIVQWLTLMFKPLLKKLKKFFNINPPGHFSCLLALKNFNYSIRSYFEVS